MRSMTFLDILEESIQLMRAGVSLDEVLARYPDQAAELKPLLETILLASPVTTMGKAPAQAQTRSKVRFLAAADAMSKRRSLLFPFSFARLAGSLLLVALLLLASVLATDLTSAEAVPGQPLYGVKRSFESARLALTSVLTSRLALQDSYDIRRADEALRLIESNEIQPVAFGGFLLLDSSLGWTVNGVQLVLTPEQAATASELSGGYVELSGVVHGAQGLVVELLQLRLYSLEGQIDSIEPGQWIVDDVRVQTGSSTQVFGQPGVGSRVTISAIRQELDSFLALSALFEGADAGLSEDPATTRTQPPAVTLTPLPQATAMPVPTATLQPTEDNSGPGGGDDDSGEDHEEDNSGSGSGDDNGGDKDDNSGPGSGEEDGSEDDVEEDPTKDPSSEDEEDDS